MAIKPSQLYILNRRSRQQEEDKSSLPQKPGATDPKLGIFLLFLGISGLITGYMDLEGRRVKIAVLDGPPAFLMSTACIVGSLAIFAGVIEQTDSKNKLWRFGFSRFRWFGTRLGWGLAMSSLATYLLLGLVK